MALNQDDLRAREATWPDGTPRVYLLVTPRECQALADGHVRPGVQAQAQRLLDRLQPRNHAITQSASKEQE